MKNILKLMKAVVAVAAVAIAGIAMAETETVGAYTWTYRITDDGKGAELYNGEYAPSISPDPDGAVAIPAKLGGKPVVSIGDYAFFECQNMTAVTIPATVTSLGKGAFEECIELEHIALPAKLTTIGVDAFRGSALRSVVIPDNVTSIAQTTFFNAQFLECVQFGKKVNVIGSKAFMNCYELTRLVFKGNAPQVGEETFKSVSEDCEVWAPKNSKGWINDCCGFIAMVWQDMPFNYGDCKVNVPAEAYSVKGGSGTVTGGGEYVVGKKVAFKAKADSGSVFCGWMSQDLLLGDTAHLSYALSYSDYVVSGESIKFVGRFIPVQEDIDHFALKPLDKTTEADGTLDLDLTPYVATWSEPKLSFKNLPAGIKYDAKTFKLAGKATKPGIYKVTVSATNVSVKRAITAEWTITVPNYTDPLLPDLADSYGPFVPGDDIVWPMSVEAEECDVTGLPSGMKWTKKEIANLGVPAYSVYGAAAKPGYYTVYFTKTVKEGTKSVKHTATSTFIISDYPRLDITMTGKGKGSVSGAGAYAMHKKVPLKATPDADSVFEGWYESGWLLSQAASYSYEKGYNDETVEARFMTKAEDYDGISVAVNVPGYGDILNGSLEAMITVPCGVYLEWSMLADSRSQSTVTVSGLPAGLKFTAKDIVNPRDKSSTLLANTIYGTPTTASKFDKYGSPIYSDVKIKVKTAGKTEKTYLIRMFVDPMQSWAVGTFNGGDGDGLLATLTVTSAGKISGKLTGFAATETLSANDFSTYDSTKYEYETSVTAKNGSFVGGYVLTITRLGNFLAVAQVHGYKDCYLYSAPWKAEPWKTLAKKFTTAAAKTLTYNALDAEGTPGMVTLQFAASGAVSVKGAFGNNSATGSTVVTPITDIYGADDEFDAYVYVELPFKANKFPGYSAKLTLHWDGTAFSLK